MKKLFTALLIALAFVANAQVEGNTHRLQVANGGARIVGEVVLPTTPVTSAGSWNILTRDITSGKVEKVTLGTIWANATLSGTPTAPTPTTPTGIANKNYVDGLVRPYKSYVASISQGSTNAPTVVLFENQLSGDIVWTRTSTGIYIGTLTGAFPSSKVFIHLSNNANNTTGQEINCVRSNNDSLSLQSFISGASTDGVVNNMSLEIRVYN